MRLLTTIITACLTLSALAQVPSVTGNSLIQLYENNQSWRASVNTILSGRTTPDSTFVKYSGSYLYKRISDNVYRYGTTGFRTNDTTGVVNIRTTSGKTAQVIGMDTSTNGTLFLSLKPPAFQNPKLTNNQPFNFYGQRFEGVNSPLSVRPNYVWGMGWNLGTNGTRLNTHEAAGGIHFETYFQNAALGGSGATGVTEFHIFTTDTSGTTNRFFSNVEPWDGRRWASQVTLKTDKLNFADRANSAIWSHDVFTNLWDFSDTVTMRFGEPRGFNISVLNGAGASYMNVLGFNNADEIEIGRQNTSGVRITPNTIIGLSASPARTLEVRGELRVTDRTTDTPTELPGFDSDGDLGTITIGSGLSLSGGTLTSTGSGGTVTGTGASGRIAHWNGTSSITSDANLLWSGSTFTVNGLHSYDLTGSYAGSVNAMNIFGTLTSTVNSATNRALYFQPIFSNDGTKTNQFYAAGTFTTSTSGSTSAVSLSGLGGNVTNSSPNVQQLYAMSGRLDENSPSGNLSNRYGLDFLVVKGAQDATDAHTGTGIRVRLQESTSTGRWATGIGASVGVENAASGTGAAISVSNAKGTNATQFGMTISNGASNSGVTVANAYGLRFIPSESASGSITNYYSIINNTTPVATTSWFLYNDKDYRNYLNGNLAVGVDVTTAKLFVRGTGTTSSTYNFITEKSDGTDVFLVRDDGVAAIGTTPVATEALLVRGSTSDNTAKAFVAERSSGTDLLGVQNDGKVSVNNAAYTEALTVNGNTQTDMLVLTNQAASTATGKVGYDNGGGGTHTGTLTLGDGTHALVMGPTLIERHVLDYLVDWTTGRKGAFWTVPARFNNYKISKAYISVTAVGSGAGDDELTIEIGGVGEGVQVITAGTHTLVMNDEINTDDVITFNITEISAVPAQGLHVSFELSKL